MDVTHTYICAMCACSIVNSSASKNVFQAVEKALRNSPFSYQGARILSGQEEGAFGWVTVNYLDDRLKQVSMCTSTYRYVHRTPGSALTECYFTSSSGLENNRRS